MVSVVLIVAGNATAGIAASAEARTCAHELAVTETSLRRTLIQLRLAATGGQDEKCNAYRVHLGVVTKARSLVAQAVRCATRTWVSSTPLFMT
jgi:hypothetical protein